MSQTLMYNGKPMTLHVGNFRSHPTCMSLTGTTEGLFGMRKDVILVASLGENIGHGKTMGMYQGFLDASNRNYPEIKRMLESSGLARPALDASGQEQCMKMGSYTFTLYNFDKQKLQQYDLKGCQTYEQNFNRARLISATMDKVNECMDQVTGSNNYPSW